ncbi:MAG: hypothetical protein ABIS38_03880 [Sphingomicrobium sp.]
MTDADVAAQAERLSRRRARMLPVVAFIFLAQQATYFSGDRAPRATDDVHIAAWLVLSSVLLIVLATGGGYIYPRVVREFANDEVTRAHRSAAFGFGFFASMIGCIALYAYDLFEPLSGRDAIHLVMTIGIAAALLRFGMLERRALKDD